MTTTEKAVALNTTYIPAIPLFMYLGISTEQIAILAVLLLIDYITGLVKAFRVGKQINSQRALSGLFTKGSILLLVMALGLAGKGIQLDVETYLNAFVITLIISETYSILGNVGTAISGEEMPEVDGVSIAIKRVRSLIEKIFFNR